MDTPLNPYSPPEEQVKDRGPAERYEDVPWFRRNGVNSALVVVGLCCSPSLLVVCVVLLTGDVYVDRHDEDGRLKRWSVANKVVAFAILLLQLAYLGMALVRHMTVGL
ncbi:MAG: hypothetical protein R3F62_03285 [Planctomycetota bacterium]